MGIKRVSIFYNGIYQANNMEIWVWLKIEDLLPTAIMMLKINMTRWIYRRIAALIPL